MEDPFLHSLALSIWQISSWSSFNQVLTSAVYNENCMKLLTGAMSDTFRAGEVMRPRKLSYSVFAERLTWVPQDGRHRQVVSAARKNIKALHRKAQT